MLRPIFITLLASAIPFAFAQASDLQHAHTNDHSVSIGPSIAQEAGIRIAIAEPGPIEHHLQVYGRLVTPPTHQAQIRARFPGLVVHLHATTGDSIDVGDTLAVIESNESLRRYEVKSPIKGIVQERFINQGEITTDAPLFTLLNQDDLWAELNIFPSQRFQIQPGQIVHIRHNGHNHDGSILSITPAIDSNGKPLPYVIARVPLVNKHRDMAAGDKVLADIDAEMLTATVRISTKALQYIEGQATVFVHEHGKYTAVPVTLGVQDDNFVEVLSGLHSGDEYVSENSYLIKADLGKSEAEHEH